MENLKVRFYFKQIVNGEIKYEWLWVSGYRIFEDINNRQEHVETEVTKHRELAASFDNEINARKVATYIARDPRCFDIQILKMKEQKDIHRTFTLPLSGNYRDFETTKEMFSIENRLNEVEPDTTEIMFNKSNLLDSISRSTQQVQQQPIQQHQEEEKPEDQIAESFLNKLKEANANAHKDIETVERVESTQELLIKKLEDNQRELLREAAEAKAKLARLAARRKAEKLPEDTVELGRYTTNKIFEKQRLAQQALANRKRKPIIIDPEKEAAKKALLAAKLAKEKEALAAKLAKEKELAKKKADAAKKRAETIRRAKLEAEKAARAKEIEEEKRQKAIQEKRLAAIEAKRLATLEDRKNIVSSSLKAKLAERANSKAASNKTTTTKTTKVVSKETSKKTSDEKVKLIAEALKPRKTVTPEQLKMIDDIKEKLARLRELSIKLKAKNLDQSTALGKQQIESLQKISATEVQLKDTLVRLQKEIEDVRRTNSQEIQQLTKEQRRKLAEVERIAKEKRLETEKQLKAKMELELENSKRAANEKRLQAEKQLKAKMELELENSKRVATEKSKQAALALMAKAKKEAEENAKKEEQKRKAIEHQELLKRKAFEKQMLEKEKKLAEQEAAALKKIAEEEEKAKAKIAKEEQLAAKKLALIKAREAKLAAKPKIIKKVQGLEIFSIIQMNKIWEAFAGNGDYVVDIFGNRVAKDEALFVPIYPSELGGALIAENAIPLHPDSVRVKAAKLRGRINHYEFSIEVNTEFEQVKEMSGLKLGKVILKDLNKPELPNEQIAWKIQKK